jgi:hypothetical protein
MMDASNMLGTALVLLAPVSFVYSWYFYFRRMLWNSSGWRGRVTLASLVLLSFAVLLWPINRMTMPSADWSSGVGVGQQVRWVNSGERIALRTLLAAFILSLFARPRLILPIILACVGTALFWDFSNTP